MRARIPIAGVAFALLFAATAPGDPPAAAALARAAESQVGVTVLYDPSYRRLAYPGGDVPPDRGVCTDVVIRAFRAIGVDLQAEVHEDMRRNFRAYPRTWGLRRPDANIDHRRVPNLMVFFDRHGKSLPLTAPYHAGDVVAFRLPSGLHHIGIVARGKTASGRPLVVHNIGQGARLEDVLESFEKIGHYRWETQQAAGGSGER